MQTYKPRLSACQVISQKLTFYSLLWFPLKLHDGVLDLRINYKPCLNFHWSLSTWCSSLNKDTLAHLEGFFSSDSLKINPLYSGGFLYIY